MLDEFIAANREAIVSGARARVASRKSPHSNDLELIHGIPVFLDQLGDALRLAKSTDEINHEQLGQSAGWHGNDLFQMGLTIGQVVHGYGDVCQVVTELAVQQKIPISNREFRLLNLCLDDAIAGAVSEWTRLRENVIRGEGIEVLGMLAHELRNLLNSGMLAYESLRRGHVAIGGSTGRLLGRSLMGLRDLIDRSLADVRLDAGVQHFEHFVVADLLGEIEVAAAMQAEAREVFLVVSPVPAATIDGDRQIVAAALANLLQNAVKFSHRGGTVTLTTRATDLRVIFEIEDECGGLGTTKIEQLFKPFSQQGENRTGLGLGLSICLKAATLSGGEISARDVPGRGCVFTLDLPKERPSPLSVGDAGAIGGRNVSAIVRGTAHSGSLPLGT